MADYSKIGEDFGIIYTCNCGWLDRAHSYPDSKCAGMGVANLWKRIQNEDGGNEVMGRHPAYVLSYRQDAVKKIGPLKLYPGAGNFYVVRRKLAPVHKQQVALAIFMEVSLKFEELQNSWLARKLTGTDSGYSEEDLVSNLIGFYKALYPKLDLDALCKPVSVEASRKGHPSLRHESTLHFSRGHAPGWARSSDTSAS